MAANTTYFMQRRFAGEFAGGSLGVFDKNSAGAAGGPPVFLNQNYAGAGAGESPVPAPTQLTMPVELRKNSYPILL